MKVNDIVTPSHWMTYECFGISYDDNKFKIIAFLGVNSISVESVLTGKSYITFMGNFKLFNEES